jgi:hypothetical protein
VAEFGLSSTGPFFFGIVSIKPDAVTSQANHDTG